MDSTCRKRLRSSSDDVVQQCKFFINQQIIDSRNKAKLKEIHDKTVNKLFRGANNLSNNNNNKNVAGRVRLAGNGTIAFENNQKPMEFPNVRSESNCCKKAALVNSECRNCNLQICEFCAYSCVTCCDLLCGACVSLFGCGTIDSPCCDQCKIFS